MADRHNVGFLEAVADVVPLGLSNIVAENSE